MLDEGVVNKFFLEEKVLVLLLPLTESLLILIRVQIPQLVHLLLSIMFRGQGVQDLISCLDPAVVSLVFGLEEVESILFPVIVIDALIVESIKVFVPMIINCLRHPISQLVRFLLNRLELIHSQSTHMLQLAL